MESRVNSWRMSECARLAAMERMRNTDSRHQAKARDAADLLLTGYLRAYHHLSLDFVSAPDTTDHHNPTPDCVYCDRDRDLRLAVEVKTVYDRCHKQCLHEWSRFFGDLASARWYEYVILHEARLPPKPAQKSAAQAAVAGELGEALSAGCPSVALDLILGFPVRVGGLRRAPVASAASVHVAQRRDIPSQLYAGFVASANTKLREWAGHGFETMLLFDVRPRGTFSSRGFGEFQWQYADFDSLDHVLTLDLNDSGVGFESIWRRPNSRIQTPGGWLFKPDGWYDD